MTPEQNRNDFPVEMKELKEDGLSNETLKFPSYREVDKFVHRGENYVYGIVKKSKQGLRKRKYIISSPTFQYGREVNGTYYIITKINHKQVATMDDVRAFYMSHPSYHQAGYAKYTERPKKSREQLLLEKERRRHLLLVIDTKYGDIDKAQGSPELEEFREMIGANEDGKGKKHED